MGGQNVGNLSYKALCSGIRFMGYMREEKIGWLL